VFDEDLVSLVETEVIYKSVPEHFKLVELVCSPGPWQAFGQRQNGGRRHLVGPYSVLGDGPVGRHLQGNHPPGGSKCTLLSLCESITAAPMPRVRWRCAWKRTATWSPARGWTRM